MHRVGLKCSLRCYVDDDDGSQLDSEFNNFCRPTTCRDFISTLPCFFRFRRRSLSSKLRCLSKTHVVEQMKGLHIERFWVSASQLSIVTPARRKDCFKASLKSFLCPSWGLLPIVNAEKCSVSIDSMGLVAIVNEPPNCAEPLSVHPAAKRYLAQEAVLKRRLGAKLATLNQHAMAQDGTSVASCSAKRASSVRIAHW